MDKDLKILLAEIRKDFKIKDRWVFKEYQYKDMRIQTKRWQTWFQIFEVIRKSDGQTYGRTSFPMDATQSRVLSLISDYLTNMMW